MARSGGLVRRVVEATSEYTGLTLARVSEMERMERVIAEAAEDVGTMRRELSRLGYADLNYAGQQPHELTPKARLNVVQKARVAWAEDPMAGAAVDLKNAFVFGRGVPKPQAFDEEVQDVIDRTWADPQNRRICTSHVKLVEKGVDLAIQSNVFFLFFDDGDDGRVRMSLAEHDTFVNAVRHPEERQRILYYKASKRDVRWDWTKGEYVAVGDNSRPKTIYYEALDAFANLEDAVDVEDLDSGTLPAPPAGLLAPGKVYHLTVNKGSEAIFGTPRFKRLLRWFNAYEQTMRTSIDLMKAAASVYMKAQVSGGRQQVERASIQATRRASPLTQLAVEQFEGSEFMPTPPPAGPSILYENAGLVHSPFSLDPHAKDSAAIATQARMQIASNTFPMHYLGDQSQSNLATSASVELPVLKLIEEEQEIWEGLFRTLADLAIKRAVDTGWLSEFRDPTDDELERMRDKRDEVTGVVTPGEKIDAYDEVSGKMRRDLGYNFSLPNPLKRVLADLVAAISTIAATFDPQNQNVALNRFLLGLVLEQAFDVNDPKRIVDEVFPSNFDPTPPAPPPTVVHVGPDGKPLAVQPGAHALGAGGTSPGGAVGADGKRHPATNPYGTYQSSAGGRGGGREVREGWDFTPEEMALIMEAAAVRAHRGLRPRPDDPTFLRYSEQFVHETEENLRELIDVIREHEGSAA